MNSCLLKSAISSLVFINLLLICSLTHGDNGYVSDAPGTKDSRKFTTNTLVKVYLNYSSFESHDFPDSFTQEAMERAIKTTIDRWVQISGFRLRIEYRGIDNSKVNPGDREILIRALSREATGLLAQAAYHDMDLPNKGLIIFYRQDANRNPYHWTVFPAESLTGYDFLSLLIHEMGHAFGLQHNQHPNPYLNTVMYATLHHLAHYGPYREDIEDLLDLYGRRNSLVVKVKRSRDDGRSWQDVSSNIDSKVSDTTLPLVVNRDSDRMIAFYTHHNQKPVWVIGDTSAKNWNNGTVLGGESSFYGTTGHGYDNEYMMAWVDHTAGHKIKIARSTDGGKTWHWRNPPTSPAVGTPSVHKLANNTWVLAYPAADVNIYNRSGRILTRVSTNDGASWGPAVEFYSGDEYRALGGVSVSSDGTSHVRISFAHSTDKTVSGQLRAGSIVTFTAHVDGDRLQPDHAGYNTGIQTLNGPALTKSSKKFFMAYRGINNELIVRTTDRNSYWWDDKTIVSNDHLINPSVAAIRNSNYAYFFYQQD